ncbi:DUF2264 domain-containing protein [Microvirga alba]|uniref:DUF2264 domain-containing protein n=1 Tax=Microvirga alba TaxID=2791025 RepID=A0A931BPP1_9HYPH|nr:DUF2264 domain-containing protein [Microvirga alba]MBF9232454.1 DUF2264 domain-containing protein [Microvirga alba]
MSVFTPPAGLFNPLADNPCRTREDVEKALQALVRPLDPFRSPGGARVRLGASAAHFDLTAADFEGFARPLWGLAPAAAGGATWIDWEPVARGLAAGTDPEHPEYWGPVGDKDQRLVELAAIGLTLRLAGEHVWQPLSDKQKRNVADYLLAARPKEYADNNWKFFRLMVDLGLKVVGVPFDPEPSNRFREEIDALYLGDGWYRDGSPRHVDHYIPFAFHFYGLILATLDDDPRNERFRERARAFAADISRWYADDGAALVFGRSMTYRFATGGIWGAMAFASEEALPWGVIKGYYLRLLRWWTRRPIADRDGVLSIGYTYPNLLMSENYNSAGSPYWALKAFLPLALSADHPFWSAEELPCPTRSTPRALRHPGMVVSNPPGDSIALSSGQQNLTMRFGAEKYAKFAYSARYGFSVESDERRFFDAVFDGAIGFSDDGRHGRTRETNEIALIADDTLYALWHPFPDVEVESWVYWAEPFHVRVHRVRTPRPLHTIEGGFAVAREDGIVPILDQESGRALAETRTDLSAIVDLGSTVKRTGRAHRAPPNTNLIAAKTIVPQLLGQIPAGESLLVCAVIAQGNPTTVRDALRNLPPNPDVAALKHLMAESGVSVTAMTGAADC